ncbi:MAG: hypothetical protein U0793_34345 [Gemmataceae bacterium]
MLIDDYLPRFDVYERHSILIEAAADEIYAALRTTDFGASGLVRLLLRMRALGRRAPTRVQLADFEKGGFAILDEQPGRELLIGLAGTFWSLKPHLRRIDARSFRETPPAGTARAAWNFSIEPEAGGRHRLTTETRVECADTGARWRFRPYWLLVRPGSGLIRRAMLRAIRAEAVKTRTHRGQAAG